MSDLNDMDIFARVVSAGSMSAAARALGLGPAVVSKAIKRLEDRLGTRLFQRTTRQISLTEAGQGFHARVVSILSSVEEAEAFVMGRAAKMQGLLKVSAPASFGRMHIAPHLRRFMEAYPELGINLVLTDAFSDIIADGFDLAIRIGEPHDSSLVARRLAPIRRILCATPDYLKRFGRPETLSDLRDHVCLRPHSNDVWRLVGPEGAITLRPEGRLMTNSSEVIREAVLSGMGIALRSTWDVGPELKTGELVQVLPGIEGSRHVTLSAVYPSRQFLPAKVRAFIDFLTELYGPVPYWDR